MEVCPHPLDVAAVGGRASQAQSDHVHEQTWDPQQVHGVADERRGDDVVDEERSVVRQEDAPEGHTQQQRSMTRINNMFKSSNHVQRFDFTTHSNLTLASAKNFLSKSQRKKTSRLEETKTS